MDTCKDCGASFEHVRWKIYCDKCLTARHVEREKRRGEERKLARKKETLTCKRCGTAFPWSKGRQFCDPCAFEQRRERERRSSEAKLRKKGVPKTKGVKRKCAVCNGSFINTAKVKQKYCSAKCYKESCRRRARERVRRLCRERGARKIGSVDNCNYCGAEYKIINGQSQYCASCKKIPWQIRAGKEDEQRKYAAAYRRKNAKKILLACNEWRRRKRRECDLFLLKDRLRARLRAALRGKGWGKKGSTRDIIGCSWEHLVAHIESQFKPGMTWANRRKWHIDHIVPLATAETEEDLYRLSHYTNLQPLWAKENLRKGARLESED